jgi:hypothetical protein
VGLTKGDGGEGARITSRMFFGGWLYPVAPSIGVTAGEAGFVEDEPDCAWMGKDVAQATSVTARRYLQVY